MYFSFAKFTKTLNEYTSWHFKHLIMRVVNPILLEYYILLQLPYLKFTVQSTLITFAGFPAITLFGGNFPHTTAPAPTTQPSPSSVPFRIKALQPMKQFFPILIGLGTNFFADISITRFNFQRMEIIIKDFYISADVGVITYHNTFPCIDSCATYPNVIA